MKPKTIKAWGGFTEDKLDAGWIEHEQFRDGLYGIFKTHAEARKRYQDVRPVEIRILPSKPKKKPKA